LRHRERELITKDATIREIHHRVKNNLQTVAALLRLQARRLKAAEARAALEEAVRRVGSIAIVHETLSHALDEVVDFDDIAGRVAMMAAEVSAPEARVKPGLHGKFGQLPASVATAMALVLTELLQNALQHGLTRPTGTALRGKLDVTAHRGGGQLTVTVTDNGVGLPEDFDLDSTASLGLQIVRTLVVAELGGRLEVAPQPGGGTRVLVEIPVQLTAGAPDGGDGSGKAAGPGDERDQAERSAPGNPVQPGNGTKPGKGLWSANDTSQEKAANSGNWTRPAMRASSAGRPTGLRPEGRPGRVVDQAWALARIRADLRL
jgi:two-component sensor histidine kinase